MNLLLKRAVADLLKSRSMRSARLERFSGRALLKYRAAGRKSGAGDGDRVVPPQVSYKLLQSHQSTPPRGARNSSRPSLARQGPYFRHPRLSILAYSLALVCVTLGRDTLRRGRTNVFLP